jgi:DNA-directed RNA polymerase specialized sigma54-like protein
MSPRVLLTVERFSEKVGVHHATISRLITERRLRPAFMSGKVFLFHTEQIPEVKQLLSLKPEVKVRCPRLLSAREMCRRAGVRVSTLSRAIVSGFVVPDYATEGPRRFFFFVDGREEEIRSAIRTMCPKTREKTKPLWEQSSLPIGEDTA